jgi:uncharacterized RDD family membrane protein YckC
MAAKKYAGFWIRFVAGIIDIIFLLPIFALLVFSFGVDEYQTIKIDEDFLASLPSKSNGNFIIDLATYAISITYITFFVTSKTQATLGKRLFGIYIGNRDGSRLSKPKAIGRALASILTSATLGLGFLPAAFTKEKTALHDLICDTRVFYGKK